jgi:hypothetical protein
VSYGTCAYGGNGCFTATVSCPGTADIKVSVHITNPTDAPKGTIFLHGGGGGTGVFDVSHNGVNASTLFLNAGFRLIQVAWDTPWEDTTILPKSIKTAACRPATILNYVYNNIHGGPSVSGGMCAEGNSGGAAALAYVMTEYDGSSYLDKVILTSGPVFSDLQQGCELPGAPPVTICSAGQFGCVGDPWTVKVQLPNNPVGTWTGDANCDGGSSTAGAATTDAENAAWKAMSIVDGRSDASFTYPNTALSGYLCNNSLGSAQGQGGLYFQQFTSSSQAASYSLYAVQGCLLAEDYINGTLAAGPNAGESAFTAAVDDMIDGCIKRH